MRSSSTWPAGCARVGGGRAFLQRCLCASAHVAATGVTQADLCVTRQVRRAFRYMLMLGAVSSLVLLAVLHYQFVSPSAQPNCIADRLSAAVAPDTGQMDANLVVEVRIVGVWTSVTDELRQDLRWYLEAAERGEIEDDEPMGDASADWHGSVNAGSHDEGDESQAEPASPLVEAVKRLFAPDDDDATDEARANETQPTQDDNSDDAEMLASVEVETDGGGVSFAFGEAALPDELSSASAPDSQASNAEEDVDDSPHTQYTSSRDMEADIDEAIEMLQDEAILPMDPVYEFAFEKGILLVSRQARRSLNVTTRVVELSANDPCIGGPVTLSLMQEIVGFDTAVLNAALVVFSGEGFVRARHSGEMYPLAHAAEVYVMSNSLEDILLFKVGTFFTAFFMLFASSALVALVLRQTQQRMLAFTLSLQRHVRNRLWLAPLVFTHLFESLVFVPIMLGALFFLVEFFGDQLLAFLVLISVWMSELFSIACVRTAVSLRIFPRVFLASYLLLHAYFLSYPFGYYYIAYVTSNLWVWYVMVALWDDHELPALRAGVITLATPRMTHAGRMLIHPGLPRRVNINLQVRQRGARASGAQGGASRASSSAAEAAASRHASALGGVGLPSALAESMGTAAAEASVREQAAAGGDTPARTPTGTRVGARAPELSPGTLRHFLRPQQPSQGSSTSASD